MRATWWTQATEGVNYWRAELPARFLPGKTVALKESSVQPDGDGEPSFPDQEGAAVWMFPGNTTRALLMAEMRNQGVPVLVEVDDLYFVPPPYHQISSWRKFRKSGTDDHAYQTHQQIVPWVDRVICATSELAREYWNVNQRVTVCRNSVDPADWDPDPPHQPGGVLRVGWAASDSHIYDAALIERALSWCSQQDGVEVVVIGIPAWTPYFPHRKIDWADMATYRRNLAEIDVMLCPLKPGRWANCKSDVKALEAAMAGACSVVSEVEPYRPWFGGPAMSASTPKQFLKAVKYLIAHRDEAAAMAAEAKEYVLRERSFPRAISQWEEALEFATYHRDVFSPSYEGAGDARVRQ